MKSDAAVLQILRGCDAAVGAMKRADRACNRLFNTSSNS